MGLTNSKTQTNKQNNSNTSRTLVKQFTEIDTDVITTLEKSEIYNSFDEQSKQIIKKINKQLMQNLQNPKEFMNAAVNKEQFEQTIENNLKEYEKFLDVTQIKEALLPLRELKAKTKYLQYKYIELSLFMINYIYQLHNLYRNSTSELIKTVKTQQQKDQELLIKFIQLANTLGSMQSTNVNDQSIEINDLEKLSELAYKKITNSHKETQNELSNLHEKFKPLSDAITELLHGNQNTLNTMQTIIPKKNND